MFSYIPQTRPPERHSWIEKWIGDHQAECIPSVRRVRLLRGSLVDIVETMPKVVERVGEKCRSGEKRSHERALRQAGCRVGDAKAARAVAVPCNQFLPSRSAKLRRLETSPAARRNFERKCGHPSKMQIEMGVHISFSLFSPMPICIKLIFRASSTFGDCGAHIIADRPKS